MHYANPRKHRWPVLLNNQEQRLRCGLPFLKFLFGFGQLHDVVGGIFQRDELTTTGQVDRVFERSLPAAIIVAGVIVAGAILLVRQPASTDAAAALKDFDNALPGYTVARIQDIYLQEIPNRDPAFQNTLQELYKGLQQAGMK